MSANDNPPSGHTGASALGGAPGVAVQPNHNMFQHVNGHIGVNGNSHGPVPAQTVSTAQQQQGLVNPHAVAAQQAALAAAHQILQAQMQQATAAATVTNSSSQGTAGVPSGPAAALQLSQFQQAANALQMVGSGGNATQQLLQNPNDANAAATLAAGFHQSSHANAPSASGTSTPVVQANGAPAASVAAPVAFGQLPNATAQTLHVPNHAGIAGAGTSFPGTAGIVQNPAQAAALLAAAAALGMNVNSANNQANYAAQAFALMLQQQQQQQQQMQSDQQLQLSHVHVPQPVQQQGAATHVQAPPQQHPSSPQGQQQQRVTPTPPMQQQNQMDQTSTQQQLFVPQQQPQIVGSMSQNHSSHQLSKVSVDPQKHSPSHSAAQSSEMLPAQPTKQSPKKRASKAKKLPKSLIEAGKTLNHINHSKAPSPASTPLAAKAPASSLSFNAPTQQFNHVTGAFQMPTPVAAAITQASTAQVLQNSIATIAAQAQAQSQPGGVNVAGHGHVNTHTHGTQNAIAMVEPNHSNLYSASLNPLVLSQMQNWKLDQLEGHVKLLRDTNQPVPNAVQVLLAEARKMEEKRAAKRIANRKSACTSRARKKALVAEMTRTNARLKRQAVILSLLPDLVIAIKVDGEITFCSAQVERVLRHKVDAMVGENICEVLTRPSRSALSGLISKLVAAEKAVLEDGNKDPDEGRSSNSGNTSGAAIVSEQSEQRFPPSIVNVQNKQNQGNGSPNPSDGSNGGTGVGASGTTISRSGTQSSLSNSDGVTNLTSNKTGKILGNSGDESSSSSDSKNLSKANEALNRNVRFHNEQLKIKKDAKKNGITHKDDVTGDFVTANNADARLSSLRLEINALDQEDTQEGTAAAKKTSSANEEQMEDNASFESNDSLMAGVEDRRHQKRKKAENNASDDSGYRESAESDPSREDSASSTSDTSNGGRPRPLAPTCNICLIRADLTTIWCEVTSSIRTRSLDEDDPDAASVTVSEPSKEKKQKNSLPNNINEVQQPDQEPAKIKELLLCLRPIRDGEERVSEDLRFIPKSQKNVTLVHVNNDPKKAEANAGSSLPISSDDAIKYEDKKINDSSRPMKKRQLSLNSTGTDAGNNIHASKKQAVERQGGDDTEKSAVESLILMSGHQK